MLYVSTRGQAPIASAAHVIKEGLARDGGLFVPQNIPKVHLDDILTMHAMPYSQCVASVLKLFLTDYTVDELLECAEAAYTQEKFGNDPTCWSCGTDPPWPSRTWPCRSCPIS